MLIILVFFNLIYFCFSIDLSGLAVDFNLMKSIFSNTCWKDSYARGPGLPLTQCRNDDELNGELCYPKCDSSYNGVGPICWEKCKPGFGDRGAFCIIDIDIYGKGCCCTLFSKGCCNNCRPGYTDDGCTCRKPPVSYTKKSYGRGVGQTKGCRRDEEQQAGLCYPKCRESYYGEGPICYKTCQGALKYDCGAFCAINQAECQTKLEQLVNNPILSALNLIKSNDKDRTEIIGSTIMDMLQAYLFFKC